jgi:hypothetical protein
MAKNTKAPKTKKSAAVQREAITHPHVVSFRLSGDKHGKLSEIFERGEATGVNSLNQQARKVVNDFIDGRLVYKNPADRLVDHEKIG